MIAFGLAVGNDVVKLAGLDAGKILVKCQATIDDAGCALLELERARREGIAPSVR